MVQPPALISIDIYPRIHITLLGMNDGGYRINGGVGFAVSGLHCCVSATCSPQFQVIDVRSNKDHQLEKQLINLLAGEKERLRLPHPISLTISGGMPSHYGFGSGTAIRLASLEALHILNDSPVSQPDLISASKRGGTSGIGIHTYFDGGFVFDIGKPNKGHQHLPSGLVHPDQTPLCLGRQDMPDWNIGICIPTQIRPKTQQEELEFFGRTCPIKDDDVYETLYHVAYGLYPAVIEGDKDTFCRALRAIQSSAWKKAERQEYGDDLLRLEKQIYDLGADAVAMSSLGPALFFLADDVGQVVTRIREHSLACTSYATTPMNKGRQVNA